MIGPSSEVKTKCEKGVSGFKFQVSAKPITDRVDYLGRVDSHYNRLLATGLAETRNLKLETLFTGCVTNLGGFDEHYSCCS